MIHQIVFETLDDEKRTTAWYFNDISRGLDWLNVLGITPFYDGHDLVFVAIVKELNTAYGKGLVDELNKRDSFKGTKITKYRPYHPYKKLQREWTFV
jgi:hypothetical protein